MGAPSSSSAIIVLNANDFFRNLADQPRPDLKQNQFGGVIGGPILHNRLYCFASYEGIRQINGLAADQPRIACSGTVILPPLTNDRSAQTLGAMFAGMNGQFGGVSIKPEGSNINPVALEILNFKLPDGSYLIPSPQVVNASLPLASQGLSTISTPCSYNADQVLAKEAWSSQPKQPWSTASRTSMGSGLPVFENRRALRTRSSRKLDFIDAFVSTNTGFQICRQRKVATAYVCHAQAH